MNRKLFSWNTRESEFENGFAGTVFRRKDVVFDLQWFASAEDEGRTEDPTAKKRSQAKSEGQVAKSQFLNQAFMLLTGFIMLYYLTGWIFGEMIQYTKHMIGESSSIRVYTVGNFLKDLDFTLFFILKLLSPFLVVSFILAIIINILQSGMTWTLKPLKPKWNKILPNFSKVFKSNFFSKKALVNFVRTVAVLIIIFAIEFYEIYNHYERVPLMMLMSVMDGVRFAMEITRIIFLKVLLLMVIIGIFDYFFERYQTTEQLKMKPEEVKDERKQAEGDPLIKRKLRERQFAMATARMLEQVPEADVVITNPTHYAVALKYDSYNMQAPQVVAKGKNYLALKIREIAMENNIPIEENPPVARGLYEAVEVGDFIPEKFYAVVAEILGRIYKMKQGGAAA